MNKSVFFLILVIICNPASAERLLLAGPNHDIFLGCLDCGEFADQSICNKADKGNPYHPLSIFNKFGLFGDSQSTSSPWNKFTTDTSVPIIVDADGVSFGYFTINNFRPNTVSYSRELGDMFESADGELSVLFTMICK